MDRDIIIFKNFLNDKNKNKVLIIIGKNTDKKMILLDQYKDFLKYHERGLQIHLPDRLMSYYPYYSLIHYERIKKLINEQQVDMYNPFILFVQGYEPQCPYFDIEENRETFRVKQIYFRLECDLFVRALIEEYGSKCEIINY